MKFSLFEPPVAKHLQKSREYLEDAKLKRARHQAAAEHYGALTQLYAERISRLEAHFGKTLPARSNAGDSNAAPGRACSALHRCHDAYTCRPCLKRRGS